MKITCLIDNLGSGGAQRQLVNLAVGFQERGHQVRFLTYHPADFYLPTLQEHGVEYVCHETPKPISRILTFRRELRRGNQDAVLAFLETPALLSEIAAFPRKRWGLVVSERSVIPLIHTYKGYLPRLGHHMADYITVNSASATATFAKAFPRLEDRLSIIYNLIDLERFSPPDSSQACSSAVKKLVIAAHYSANKNLQGLLDAILLLDDDSRSQLRIEWYGDQQCDYFQSCRAFIQKNHLDTVISLNNAISNISEVMQQASAVGLFSFQEGLPNAICEGLASGKPVIMSRVSDAETLVDDGENGWLCDPHSPESIADSLRQFIKADDAQLSKMGERSRQKAELLFDREKIIDQYLDLLERSVKQ